MATDLMRISQLSRSNFKFIRNGGLPKPPFSPSLTKRGGPVGVRYLTGRVDGPLFVQVCFRASGMKLALAVLLR